MALASVMSLMDGGERSGDHGKSGSGRLAIDEDEVSRSEGISDGSSLLQQVGIFTGEESLLPGSGLKREETGKNER